jgi:hypothetical protein
MEQTALFLTARVLPKVAYRQWTLSLPWRIRWAVATQPKLLSAALSVMQRRIFAWQRRRARRAGIAKPLCGSVTFVQRFDGQLRLYPHFHSLVPDGVFWRTADGSLDFATLPPPTDAEVAKLVAPISRRIETLVAEATDEGVDDEDTDALQYSLAEAAQPLHRSRWPIDDDVVVMPRPRCAQREGYSLHADVAVAADDRRGLRRLLRYGARPPLAARRVSWSAPEGKVVYKLRKPTATGRTELCMTPAQFIRRLAALTPPPWLNTTRFHGIFASASAHRQAVAAHVAAEQDPDEDPFACPPLRCGQPTDADAAEAEVEDAPAERLPPPPHVRIAWSELLRRTFDDPLVCPRCCGRMRLIAVIKDPNAIAAILDHPAHRHDDPDSGPDPPQLSLDLEPFESA